MAETRLERNALRWLNDADDYDDGASGRYRDLMHGGCQAGTVGHLIYSKDCRSFLKYHRAEINALLAEMISEMGAHGPVDLFGDKWDESDPLGYDTNCDLLAWFGFEEAARRVANRAGMEE